MTALISGDAAAAARAGNVAARPVTTAPWRTTRRGMPLFLPRPLLMAFATFLQLGRIFDVRCPLGPIGLIAETARSRCRRSYGQASSDAGINKRKPLYTWHEPSSTFPPV